MACRSWTRSHTARCFLRGSGVDPRWSEGIVSRRQRAHPSCIDGVHAIEPDLAPVAEVPSRAVAQLLGAYTFAVRDDGLTEVHVRQRDGVLHRSHLTRLLVDDAIDASPDIGVRAAVPHHLGAHPQSPVAATAVERRDDLVAAPDAHDVARLEAER